MKKKKVIQALDVTIDNLIDIRDQLLKPQLKVGDWIMTIPKGNPEYGFSIFQLSSEESVDRYIGPECAYHVTKVDPLEVDRVRKELQCGRRS